MTRLHVAFTLCNTGIKVSDLQVTAATSVDHLQTDTHYRLLLFRRHQHNTVSKLAIVYRGVRNQKLLIRRQSMISLTICVQGGSCSKIHPPDRTAATYPATQQDFRFHGDLRRSQLVESYRLAIRSCNGCGWMACWYHEDPYSICLASSLTLMTSETNFHLYRLVANDISARC